MVLPLKGKIRVTSHFKSKQRPDHLGTDLVSTDTRVYAVETGIARHRWDPISGYGVDLYVGTKKFEYIHLNKAGRPTGLVKEGAVLGNYKPGSGKVSGPHLHFALQIPWFGKQQDAWKYVNDRVKEEDVLTNKNHLRALFRQFVNRDPKESEYNYYIGRPYNVAVHKLDRARIDLGTVIKQRDAASKDSVELKPGIYKVK